jgi:hypothetical protein
MKYLILCVLALGSITSLSRADGIRNEFLCIQDFLAETGREQHATPMFIKISDQCMIGQRDIRVYPLPNCIVNDNQDGTYTVNAGNPDEKISLNLKISDQRKRNPYLQSDGKASTLGLTFDSQGASITEEHQFRCYRKNSTIMQLLEWNIP